MNVRISYNIYVVLLINIYILRFLREENWKMKKHEGYKICFLGKMYMEFDTLNLDQN